MEITHYHDESAVFIMCQNQEEREEIPVLFEEMQRRYSSIENVNVLKLATNAIKVKFSELPNLVKELKERYPLHDCVDCNI